MSLDSRCLRFRVQHVLGRNVPVESDCFQSRKHWEELLQQQACRLCSLPQAAGAEAAGPLEEVLGAHLQETSALEVVQPLVQSSTRSERHGQHHLPDSSLVTEVLRHVVSRRAVSKHLAELSEQLALHQSNLQRSAFRKIGTLHSHMWLFR
jgi:hypothetical protein